MTPAAAALIEDLEIADPDTGSRNWTDVRQFNLMFKTELGAVSGDSGIIYLRSRKGTAELADLLGISVTDLRAREIGPLLRRLQAQGTGATGLCIGATRHFRALYAVASDPGGPASGIARLRPPVFGARRDRLLRQARDWPADKLQSALSLLTDTDLKLRSAGQTAPQMALMERTLIRLAMINANR